MLPMAQAQCQLQIFYELTMASYAILLETRVVKRASFASSELVLLEEPSVSCLDLPVMFLHQK
jgi:hypothetical protein